MIKLKIKTTLSNQQGFALITAVMMLFAATILGLMAMNSSELEIILSGAQQRYEDNFNVTEGAANIEAAALGSAETVYDGRPHERRYALTDTETQNQILSPTDSTSAAFDPFDHMTDDQNAYTVTAATQADLWPMDNLFKPAVVANADDRFGYHYRVTYLRQSDTAVKGYSAEGSSGIAAYKFEIAVQRTTQIDLGGTKIGKSSN